MTLPGEGKDRVFRVAIKWLAKVSLYALEEALEGRSRTIPLDVIQALDVVMRHLPSMTYVSFTHFHTFLLNTERDGFGVATSGEGRFPL